MTLSERVSLTAVREETKYQKHGSVKFIYFIFFIFLVREMFNCLQLIRQTSKTRENGNHCWHSTPSSTCNHYQKQHTRSKFCSSVTLFACVCVFVE